MNNPPPHHVYYKYPTWDAASPPPEQLLPTSTPLHLYVLLMFVQQTKPSLRESVNFPLLLFIPIYFPFLPDGSFCIASKTLYKIASKTFSLSSCMVHVTHPFSPLMGFPLTLPPVNLSVPPPPQQKSIWLLCTSDLFLCNVFTSTHSN